MPTSQAPTLLQLIDDVERLLEAASNTDDLQELRAILRRPTRVAVAERTYLMTMLGVLIKQLEAVRDLRSGLVDSLRQARPAPPEGTE
jgi:hypothetical protein